MASNFQKVVDFNTQFGVLQSNEFKPKTEILTQEPNTVEHCLILIREEMAELEQAVTDSNFIEVVDALADILYVVYGAGARFGINMDLVFNMVHDNNMTKLCKTEDEAKRSVEDYIKCRNKLLEIEKNIKLFEEYKSKAEKHKSEFEKYRSKFLEFDETVQNIKKTGQELSDFGKNNVFSSQIVTNNQNEKNSDKVNESLTMPQKNNMFEVIKNTEQFCKESEPILKKVMKYLKNCEENKNLFEENKSKFKLLEKNIDWEFYEKNKQKLNFDTPNYRKAPNGTHWVIYNESSKKVLKSIEYEPVDLTDVCK